MGRGGVHFDLYYCQSRQGMSATAIMALSMALFLMVNLTNNHSDVFMYIRYISFTYSLMGVYLACQGLFSSLDSSITVFSVTYYGCGCFLFLIAGFLIFSHGHTEALGIISALFSIVLGLLMAIYMMFGSKM